MKILTSIGSRFYGAAAAALLATAFLAGGMAPASAQASTIRLTPAAHATSASHASPNCSNRCRACLGVCA